MESLALRTIQMAQLDLLLEFDRICKKNNLAYFLIGGSLIGAIRHQGFIPWDDDVDIGMLREEYEKFKSIVSTEVDSEYCFYDWENDIYSPLPFGKLKIKGSQYTEGEAEGTGMNDEIFIDIFPFDKPPKNYFIQKKQKYKIKMIRKMLQLRLGWTLEIGKSNGKRIVYRFLLLLSLLHSVERWKSILLHELTRYNSRSSQWRVNMCGAYSYEREMVPLEYISSLISWKFEGYFVSIPLKYDKYLQNIYGNYMILPSEEKRGNKHGIIKSSLGDYKIRCKEYEG